MSFIQVFGATVIAIAVYVVVLSAIVILFLGSENIKSEILFTCLFSGVAMFACLFIAWYMGVPVPAWMK